MFSKAKLAAAAQEIADQLQVIQHVKALEQGQKELADAIKALGERVRDLETDMRVFKSEVKLEALKEAQGVVIAVQGGLNQRIEDVAVKVALIERNAHDGRIELGPRPALNPPIAQLEAGGSRKG